MLMNIIMALKIKIFIFLMIFQSSNCLIAFDCGSTTPNITTFSLIDSGECHFQDTKINSTTVQIKLVQMAEIRETKVIHCKIEIHRTIYHCGMFGHLLPVENAEQNYIFEISKESCQNIHTTGIFKYDNTHIIANLKVNSTTSKGIIFAGSAEGNSCSGSSYADNFGTWNKVLVQGSIKITLMESTAQVNLNQDKIRLITNTVCKFSDKSCLDIELGYSFWNTLQNNQCFDTYYDILYSGKAEKIYSENNHEIVYSLNSAETTFALTVTGKILRCNREFISTEHPKLFIYENVGINNYYFSNDIKDKNIINIDLFSYVNSKFIYVQKHLKNQFNSLYLNLLTQKCELERKTIQNSLSLLTLSPDMFAYEIMKKPGYIAKITGEAVHLIQCIPREVKILHSQKCYNELPVFYGNDTWFITPITHILTKRGNQINCNLITPSYFKIANFWIKMNPKPENATPPNIFRPNTKIEWTYKDISSLASTGIYSQTDLNDFQDHLMFPLEKAAILNSIALELTGQSKNDPEIISGLFTTNVLKNFASTTWHTIKDSLITWGSFSSSIIMILIILHIIKLVINTVIQGYTLHAIYGWSIHLLAALFGSVTHLLVVLNTNKQRKMYRKREDIRLQDIKVISTPSTTDNTIIDSNFKFPEQKSMANKYKSIPPHLPPKMPINHQYEIPKNPKNEKELFSLKLF